MPFTLSPVFMALPHAVSMAICLNDPCKCPDHLAVNIPALSFQVYFVLFYHRGMIFCKLLPMKTHNELQVHFAEVTNYLLVWMCMIVESSNLQITIYHKFSPFVNLALIHTRTILPFYVKHKSILLYLRSLQNFTIFMSITEPSHFHVYHSILSFLYWS